MNNSGDLPVFGKDMSDRNTQHQEEFNLLNYIRLFARHRLLIVIVTGVFAIAGFFFITIASSLPPEISYLPDVNKPYSLILINEMLPGDILGAIFSTQLQALAGMDGNLSANFSYGDLALRLLKSRSILDAVSDEFGLMERYGVKNNRMETRNHILNNLEAVHDEKTMTITISYTDYDPALATRVVDKFVELLGLRFLSISGVQKVAEKELLETKIGEVAEEISRMEARVEIFQKTYGVLDIDSLATEQITMMARFRSQLILKEMEIKTYTDLSRIDDPALRKLRAERDNLVKLIEDLESGFSEYEGLIPAQADLPRIARDFRHAQRDLAVQETIYQTLIQQYELLKLSLEGEKPVFQVLERAEVPDLKVAPKRRFLMIVFIVAGFVAGLVLSYVVHVTRRVSKALADSAKNEEGKSHE